MKSKKKKKREKRIRENKHLHSIRGAYLKKYPSLFVHNKYASLDLVHEVENICKVIDFRQCPEKKRQMFSDHKTMLSHRFIKKYTPNSSEESFDNDDFGFRAMATEDYCEYVSYIDLENYILVVIYNCLEQTGAWAKHMPLHNVVVKSYKGDFVVIVDGFHQHHSSFGKGYYTEKPIYVDIPQEDETAKQYRVAMSMHALERVFGRAFKCSLDDDTRKAQYPIFLYQFGLYNECRAVKMSDGWAAAIYATYRHGPDMPHSLAHKIAYEILDRMEGFKMLCGYCPIGFCKDEFVHFKTLLSPGMRGTPEEKLIKSVTDRKQREKYERMISDTEFTDDHIELIKFFQNSGYHVVEYLNEDE